MPEVSELKRRNILKRWMGGFDTPSKMCLLVLPVLLLFFKNYYLLAVVCFSAKGLQPMVVTVFVVLIAGFYLFGSSTV